MTRSGLIVEADGGSRGNPGVAGYGALVRDAASGAVLLERAAPLGRASNNVAEYSGLIAGLQAADEIDPAADVEVRMDSKLVIEQMSGRWKIKHEDMRRLAAQAREAAAGRTRRGGRVSYTWVPRERNKDADRLSNQGMDGHTVDRRPEPPDPHPDAGGTHPDGSGDQDGSADDPRDPGGAGEDSDELYDTRTDAPEPGAAAADAPVPGPEDPGTDPSGAGTSDGIATGGATSGAGTSDGIATEDRPRGGAHGEAAGKAVGCGPDLGRPARIVLVRHGVTEHTRTGLLDGRGGPDAPLTVEGRRQAQAAGEGVRAFLGEGPVRLVTSSLSRARQSGAVMASVLGVEPVSDPAWDEQDFGDWEGRTTAQALAEDPQAYADLRLDDGYARPGGETRHQVRDRVVGAYRALAQEALADGRPVVVVSHRAALLALLGHCLQMSPAGAWSLSLAPGSLTSVKTWRDGGLLVEFVNDTAHLR